MVNDLVLTLELNRCTHENERCVEGVFVAAILTQGQVFVASGNDSVLNALFLAIMVDAHVSDRTQAQLGDLGEPVLHLFLNDGLTNKLVELFDCITAK